MTVHRSRETGGVRRTLLVVAAVALAALGSIALSTNEPAVVEAHGSPCSVYAIDCTNPGNAQSQLRHTKSCGYYAQTVRTKYASFGNSYIDVQMRFASGGSGATCNSAWSRASSWACNTPVGCAPGNPKVWVIRGTPNLHSMFSHSDDGTYSRQLRDCCGGLSAQAKGRISSQNGNVVVHAATSAFGPHIATDEGKVTMESQARRRPQLTALALAGMLTLAGCGHVADDTSNVALAVPERVGDPEAELPSAPEESNGSKSPRAPTDEDYVNPLDAWFSGGRSASEIEMAIEQSVADCMRAAGHDWPDPTPPAPTEPITRGALREYRSTDGYGLAVASGARGHVADLRSMSEDERVALLDTLEGSYDDETGERDGGCRGKATDDALQVVQDRAADPVAGELWNSMLTDPRLVAATATWSRCMTDAGFGGVESPQNAAAFVVDMQEAAVHHDAAVRESALGADEMAVARADTACAEQHLWDTWFELGSDAVRKLENR